jgi:PAS domain S-box-containing protein
VGTSGRFPPYSMLDDNGRPFGFSIDVMDEVARLSGLKVKYKVLPSGAIPALRDGTIDVIPSLGISERRMKNFSFTRPIETFSISFFLRQETAGINGVSDLSGRKVGAVKPNLAHRLLSKRQDIALTTFKDIPSALFALMSAEIDVFAYPEPVALKIAREAGIEDRLKLAKEPLTEVKRGIAVQKGNMALLAKLDPAVKTFLATDAYRNIYTKWFGKPKPYWTVARVTWDMLGIIVVLIVGMLWWRNRVAARMIQASRMGEKQFKGMFEHVGVGFAQTSLDGRFLLVNDRFVDIVGHDRDALLSLSFKEITYSEDLSIDIPAMKDLVDGRRQNYNTEKRYIRADGGVVWVSLTVVMVRDDVGEPDYFLAVIENITERKQIEREAVEKSALLETTIATMAQGYVFYNADFQLVAFNAQYERMFEFSPDFLRPGMPMEDVVRNRITRLLGLTGSSNEDRIQGHIERAKNIRELTEERSLPNGLTYVYHRKPLPEGGFMTT